MGVNLDVEPEDINTLVVNIRKRGNYKTGNLSLSKEIINMRNLQDKDLLVIAIIKKMDKGETRGGKA